MRIREGIIVSLESLHGKPRISFNERQFFEHRSRLFDISPLLFTSRRFFPVRQGEFRQPDGLAV